MECRGGVEMNSDTADFNLTPPDESGVSQCQKSLDSDSDTPPAAVASEAPEGVVRILLSKLASDALTAAGADCFAVVSRATWPDDPNRWVIHIAPVAWESAIGACKVLLGTHCAAKKRDAGESAVRRRRLHASA